MLILGRHRDEQVVIDGGRIVVTVLEIVGNKVRLGFQAPPEIAINRGEVQEKIDRAKGGAR